MGDWDLGPHTHVAWLTDNSRTPGCPLPLASKGTCIHVHTLRQRHGYILVTLKVEERHAGYDGTREAGAGRSIHSSRTAREM